MVGQKYFKGGKRMFRRKKYSKYNKQHFRKLQEDKILVVIRGALVAGFFLKFNAHQLYNLF